MFADRELRNKITIPLIAGFGVAGAGIGGLSGLGLGTVVGALIGKKMATNKVNNKNVKQDLEKEIEKEVNKNIDQHLEKQQEKEVYDIFNEIKKVFNNSQLECTDLEILNNAKQISSACDNMHVKKKEDLKKEPMGFVLNLYHEQNKGHQEIINKLWFNDTFLNKQDLADLKTELEHENCVLEKAILIPINTFYQPEDKECCSFSLLEEQARTQMHINRIQLSFVEGKLKQLNSETA